VVKLLSDAQVEFHMRGKVKGVGDVYTLINQHSYGKLMNITIFKRQINYNYK